MGYIFYSSFISNEFGIAATALTLIYAVLSGLLLYAHAYAILNNRTRVMESVKKVNFEVMLYYGFNFFAGLPAGIAILVYDSDIDNSLMTCNVVYILAAATIFLSNFLLYRLLISKSTLYDPMSQMSRLSRVTWIFINYIYLPLLFYGIAATLIWSRAFHEVHGNRHCVEEHTVITVSLLTFVDFAISIMCITILAAPTILSPTTKEVWIVVVRNCSTMSVAVLSTLLFFIYIILGSNGDKTDSQKDYFIVRIGLRLGSLDLFTNFLMVSLSWPLSFYHKILYDSGKKASSIISSAFTTSTTSQVGQATGGSRDITGNQQELKQRCDLKATPPSGLQNGDIASELTLPGESSKSERPASQTRHASMQSAVARSSLLIIEESGAEQAKLKAVSRKKEYS
mmetsp:Transcript_2938/g.5599  ORF Transcript_2938/g.5599 Transcript_2938/m.5599 type:complete len:398 (+) Transcript_2938:105-1298(+)